VRKFFLKTPIDDYDLDSILQMIAIAIRSNKTKIVVTPNLDHVVRNYRDDAQRDIYRKAWLSINDSGVIPLLALLQKVKIGHINPGSDLTRVIFNSGLLEDSKVAVVGGETKDIKCVMDSYGITKFSHYNPAMGFINDEEATQQCAKYVIAQSANITFLCVGSPQQEKLAEVISTNSTNSGLLVCVGASLEFLSGKQKRAPKIFRKLRLEWFHRLIQNPRRLAVRYLVRCPKALGYLFLEFLSKKDQAR
jgi:N-acetylglucosaminyldiphosphoundecaprenol N-acetyl-beta-D-mannosaminyltransferase